MSNNRLEKIYYFYEKHHGPRPDVYNPWKEILERGDSPNEEWDSAYDRRRASPLFSAVLDESLQLTELLLNAGAELNEHNRDGRTVLQEAIILAHSGIVLLLLDRGANSETQISSGFLLGGTALHLAVTEGLVDIVRDLLDHGADTQARTQVGWTPLDVAVLDRHTTVLEVLLSRIRPITAAGQASDVEAYGSQKLKIHEDRTVIASHLLEHGVRDTERKHVLFFRDYLSKTIKKMDSSITNTLKLSTRLIWDMEVLLLNEGKVTGEMAWSRNLCETCKQLENQDSHNVSRIYEHKRDFSSLVSSSKDGCNLCNLFMESLNNQWSLLSSIDSKWLTEFGVSPKVRVKVGRKEGENPVLGEYRLIVACGDKISFADLDHVQKHLNTAVAEIGPSDNEGTASDRSLAVAKAWLQRCEDEHPSCRRSELGGLPKRVIDCGSMSSEPRIYISTRERVPYVTLSYCWGHHQNIRLLSTNVDAYTQCLPFASLPQTIADAVSVARRMNIKYLWVDSLCILQDSEVDLKQELSYMGDIYANAWLTIAAKSSSSCTSGLFHRRNWPTSAIVPTEIRMPSKTMQRQSGIHGRMENTRTSCINRLMALPRHHRPSDDDKTPVLESRGWTLQEELLSRRMLNFGKHELSWTCLEGYCTERIPKEKDIRAERKWQYIVKRLIVTGFANYGNNWVNKDGLFNYWLELVENFLRRKLSESKDKLAALAGVQGAIGKILEDEPLVGIWGGQFFAPSLLWWIEVEQKDDLTSSLHSPSWSWASTSQPVKYVKHPSRTDNSRPWVWHHEVKYYPEAVSWNIDNSRLDSIDGCVTVRCKLLREADLDCERYVVNDFQNAPPRSRSGKEAIHFETHHDFEDAAAVSDSWLMLVRTCQFIPGTRDRGYKYDIETHLLRLEKISPDRADFRRVGLVYTRSWANKWLKHATEETVRLF